MTRLLPHAFSSDLRSQQLEELSSAPIEVSEAEKKANQEFVLSSALVGLISVGNLFYPPLSLLSVRRFAPKQGWFTPLRVFKVQP